MDKDEADEPFFTIYLNPGVDKVLDCAAIARTLDRDLGWGNDYIRVYTSDPGIIKKAIWYIGRFNIREIPELDHLLQEPP